MSRRLLPFKRYGGKSKVLQFIVSELPPPGIVNLFVDAFCGSGVVLLNSGPWRGAVLNDRDDDVVNFFSVLRDRGDELIAALVNTPYSRAEFERCKRPADDVVERARRFSVRSTMAYSGMPGFSRGTADSPSYMAQFGKRQDSLEAIRARLLGFDDVEAARQFVVAQNQAFNATGGFARPPVDRPNLSKDEMQRVNVMAKVRDRLRYVAVENMDVVDLIERYDHEKVMFYCDPPYLHETRTSTKDYRHEMDRDDHMRFLDAATKAAGLVLVSGYPSSLYNDALASWRRIEKDVPLTAGVKKKQRRIKVLWANYDEFGGRL